METQRQKKKNCPLFSLIICNLCIICPHRTQWSGPKSVYSTFPPPESSPATEPSPSTPVRSGGCRPLTSSSLHPARSHSIRSKADSQLSASATGAAADYSNCIRSFFCGAPALVSVWWCPKFAGVAA